MARAASTRRDDIRIARRVKVGHRLVPVLVRHACGHRDVHEVAGDMSHAIRVERIRFLESVACEATCIAQRAVGV